MRRMESAASRCRAVAGGEGSMTARLRRGAGGTATLASDGDGETMSADAVRFASFADGES